MFFLEKLLENYKEKRSECYTEMSVALTDWSSFMSSLLNKEGLIERSSYVEKLSELYNIASIAGKLNSKFVILSDNATIEFKNLYKIFQHEVNSFESSIEKHNTIYLNGLINDARKVIGKIEEHNLDNQQMMCILKNASNHNVVAGAGTGKTTTIIGKVKYLINTKKFKPNEILVLSYTHAAAYEMKMRLKRNVSSDIGVSTFHRFGYYILTTVEKKKPLIFSESPTKILKEQLSTLIQDNTYKKKLLKYIGNSSGKDCSDLDSRFQTIHDSSFVSLASGYWLRSLRNYTTLKQAFTSIKMVEGAEIPKKLHDSQTEEVQDEAERVAEIPKKLHDSQTEQSKSKDLE